MIFFKYFQVYFVLLQDQVCQLIVENCLGEYFECCYLGCYDVQSDKVLYVYIMNFKQEYLCNVLGLDKVFYDNKFDVVQCVFGLYIVILWVQGGKFKVKKEICVVFLFKDVVFEFLWMIVVYEFVYLKESEYNKVFYQFCQYMLLDYYQLEFDLWVYLIWKSFQWLL